MHCFYFICERKFLRTYARKNYATLEINPNAFEVSLICRAGPAIGLHAVTTTMYHIGIF